MVRCRHCLTRNEPRNGCCPVCGLTQNKMRSDLGPDEKKIRLHARAIRGLAMLHLIGAALGILILAEFPSPVAMLVLVAVNAGLAFGLARFSLTAYKAATVYYFLIGMVNVISIQRGGIHLGWIAFALIALYIVGNGTAKALFERQHPTAL